MMAWIEFLLMAFGAAGFFASGASKSNEAAFVFVLIGIICLATASKI